MGLFAIAGRFATEATLVRRHFRFCQPYAGSEGQHVSDHPRRLPNEGCRREGNLRRQGKEPPQSGRVLFHRHRCCGPPYSELVKHIADIDFIPTDTEVDALLKEARLVKDIRPRFNSDLKDDKTFPYLQIRIREEFPRVEFTRKPRRRGVKLYGPFTSARSLRAAIQVLNESSSFALVPWTFARTMIAGGGSALACSTASASARPRATSA